MWAWCVRRSSAVLDVKEWTLTWEIGTVQPDETVTRYLEGRVWGSVQEGWKMLNCITVKCDQLISYYACAETTITHCDARTPTPTPMTPTATPSATPSATATATPGVTGPTPGPRFMPLIFKWGTTTTTALHLPMRERSR